MASSKENQSRDLRSEGVISKGKSVTTPFKWDTCYVIYSVSGLYRKKKKKKKTQTTNS